MIELKPIAHILYNQIDGKPHYSEFCISNDAGSLQEEADRENGEANDGCEHMPPEIVVAPVYGPETVGALVAENDELQVQISSLEARNASLQKIMDLAKDAVLGGAAAWSWTGYPNRKQLTRFEPESWKNPRNKSPLFSQEQVQGIVTMNNDLHARNSELEAQLAEAKNKLADAEARQIGRTWP